MDKIQVYETLKSFEKYSIVNVKWDGRNGELEALVRFDGFDKDNNPQLILSGKNSLDIEKIGGYSSIISIEEECPDGYCVRRICEDEPDGMH